ncbi:AAA family ATPase [Acetobacterium bakii]|uniref:AAA family ATPase n=1 Tax=Acetobacterium bakii TaxID=52689 RepID=UPI0006834A15|nr:AAA family ATPase [Acetobacterium bakii]
MANINYWFVGANYNYGDQTSRFLEESIWENGYSYKYDDLVKSIQPGDRIAIKRKSNRKKNLPFDSHGKLVSVMKVKATGIVTGNDGDGKTIHVQWIKDEEPREWYFFTHIKNIWKVERDTDNWMNNALIEFAFYGKPQDINRFKNDPDWKERYTAKQKISYKSEIIAALTALGGEAQLECIQEEIQKRNKLKAIHNDPDWYALVRGTLQWHSSDSRSFRQEEDLFYRKSFSSGIWGLRENTHGKIKELYSKAQFLSDIYMSASKYDEIVVLLKRKRAIIIKSIPGRDENFLGKKLAFSLLKEKDESKVLMIQCDQIMASEDFILGYQQTEEGKFNLKTSAFVDFCKSAIEDSDHEYYLVIDEINCGNLSKIIAELLLLIEGMKRGTFYKKRNLDFDKDFFIPENLYIISTINTTKTSFLFIENTLRRRFDFVEIEPDSLIV